MNTEKRYYGEYTGTVIDGIHKGMKCYRRKSTRMFIEVFLKQSAKITLALDNGDIIFEGENSELNTRLLKDLYVLEIYGLGSLGDIIIILTYESDFYE